MGDKWWLLSVWLANVWHVCYATIRTIQSDVWYHFCWYLVKVPFISICSFAITEHCNRIQWNAKPIFHTIIDLTADDCWSVEPAISEIDGCAISRTFHEHVLLPILSNSVIYYVITQGIPSIWLLTNLRPRDYI